ncbi:MAG: DUF4142 domain-containing protein [Verrucomicrobiaceae bacterium]|nr:MAG: DUF4142 domain-containing protein [Verrucomicrobiaceae bacterium]
MKFNNRTPRRVFLKSSLITGAGLSTILARTGYGKENGKEESKTEDGKSPGGEDRFRKGLVGPARLSLATSKIAQEKASDKTVKAFAGFELAETTAVLSVLQDLGTPEPPPDPKDQAALAAIQGAESGPAFDKAYIKAQIETHQILHDHTAGYLENSSGGDLSEKHGRHLAILALTTIREHMAICHHISQTLNG